MDKEEKREEKMRETHTKTEGWREIKSVNECMSMSSL